MDKQSLQNRDFMKTGSFATIMQESDQAKGVQFPNHSVNRGGKITTLPSFDASIGNVPYLDLLEGRRSVREYNDVPMTQEQLSFLLWSIYSVQDYRGDTKAHTLRLIPSGGARHTLEVYFAAINVEGLEPGLYHYLPLEDVGKKQASIERIDDLPSEETLAKMVLGQDWVTSSGALFFISSVPYRGEWRYGSLAHRMILSDVGYMGQNFSLSAVAMNMGSCQMAGYDQALCDEILGLDGENEFVIIAMSVGNLICG